MKTLISFILLFQVFIIQAQTKYNYDNPNLDMPKWLTNPNYIEENSGEGIEINIEENKLAMNGNISIVKLFMAESKYNHSSISIYLGTFNKNNKIIDIMHVANLSSSDWNWQNELSFEEIEQGIIEYYCEDLTYRPAESEDEQQENGGMVISKADTTIAYFGVDKNGSIAFSENLEEIKYLMKHPGSSVSENMIQDNTDTESVIVLIRKKFNTINQNLPSYQKKVKKTGESMIITNYYDGDILKFIKEINTSNGQSIDYFFENQTPIFIFTKNNKSNSESRYYFNNNKMIRWLKGSSREQVEPDSSEFNKKADELLSRCKTLSGN